MENKQKVISVYNFVNQFLSTVTDKGLQFKFVDKKTEKTILC